jgi:uncharacterized protein (UPF0335 family)
LIENLESGRAPNYQEAKSVGFDVAALRTFIKLRKQDKDERDMPPPMFNFEQT